jgi:hypothetical protein
MQKLLKMDYRTSEQKESDLRRSIDNLVRKLSLPSTVPVNTDIDDRVYRVLESRRQAADRQRIQDPFFWYATFT